jgi:8-oxo-dGTP pyrophosphatase MutT (NUDIX family)
LPKGLISAGDSPEDTALREVAEETGIVGRADGKLGDVKYVYTWKGERIFKVVSFFLVRYEGGRLGGARARGGRGALAPARGRAAPARVQGRA